MNQGHSCDWMLGTKDCENHSICRQYNPKGCTGPRLEKSIKKDADLCSLNNSSQLSSSSTMSQDFTPTFVYHRKRRNRDNVSIPSKIPSVASKENMVSFFERASTDGSREALISVNENCSSSESNLDSASLKIDAGHELGECSSSGILIAEKVPEEVSEFDICISILRSQGLLDNRSQDQDQAAAAGRNTDTNSEKYCSKSCKKCEKLESTLNLLICDNCEDAFHTSCCNPRIIRVPAGEWLCSSCLKKKRKILKSASNTVNISTEASEDELGSLAFMFTDTEPYMSNARVGDEFQASVPNWSGPIEDDSDLIGEPLEMDISNDVGMQEWNPTKALKLSSIGNWLQCQEVIEGTGGDDEIICGKWRRAPLLEVQTDDWDCFCCILWDPAHADCAVPQEVDTEEVKKQLKYMEMLRPRLAAKRRKLGSSKSSSGSQDDKFRGQ